MRRRAVITTVATAVSVTIAGCGGESGGEPPAPGTDPATLLPDATNGWEGGTPEELSVEVLGGEAGSRAEYTSPSGNSYEVEIAEWSDAEAASGTVDLKYRDWAHAVSRGVFSFACDGPESTEATELLSKSPALSSL